jgi:hypothetical protein
MRHGLFPQGADYRGIQWNLFLRYRVSGTAHASLHLETRIYDTKHEITDTRYWILVENPVLLRGCWNQSPEL